MKKVNSIIVFLVVLFFFSACARKQYVMNSATGYLVEMNNGFDSRADPKMASLVQTYKNRLDTKMNEVIGEADQALTKTGLQNALANFTADALQEYGTDLWGAVDFAVINNGGLRTTLNQGAVTVSNVYEIYPFENHVVLLELPGKAVRQLFESFTQKMEGFSKGVQLTLKDHAIESITIGGKPLDEKATYKIVTLDFLAEGNSGMEALTKATNYTDSNIIVHDAMIDYIKKLTAKNKTIHATIDDRIKVKE